MSSLKRDWNPVRARTSIRSHFPGMDPMKTTKLLTVLESFESEEEAIESFLVERDDDTNPIFT